MRWNRKIRTRLALYDQKNNKENIYHVIKDEDSQKQYQIRGIAVSHGSS